MHHRAGYPATIPAFDWPALQTFNGAGDSLGIAFEDLSEYPEALNGFLTSRAEELYLMALAAEGPDRAKEPEVEARKQLDLLSVRLGPNHFRTLVTRLDLGHALTIEGRYAQAEVELQATKAGLARLVGPEHLELIRCDFELSRLCATQRRWDEAADSVYEAWQLSSQEMGPEAATALLTQSLYAAAPSSGTQ